MKAERVSLSFQCLAPLVGAGRAAGAHYAEGRGVTAPPARDRTRSFRSVDIMTPGRVNLKIVADRLGLARRYQADLETMKAMGAEVINRAFRPGKPTPG